MPRDLRFTLYRAACLCVVLVATSPVEASTPCAQLAVMHRALPTSADQPAKRTLTVASLNMAGHPRIGDDLAAWIHERAIDILLLQEVGHLSMDGEAFVATLADRLALHSSYGAATLLGNAYTQGLAIVSRYPLTDIRVYPLAYHRLRFRSRCRIALAATVTTTYGPVRVVNVHLDTRINSKDRVAQVAPLLQALDGVDIPQIIGGDFNTMNVRWLQTMWPLPYLQRQSAAVQASLAAEGFDTPLRGGRPTFKFLGFPLRLDWIYLKRLEPLDWSVDDIRLTDHRGVWARVRW
jgi:endonuclease/exonuclease/phosphatase family metal-dependent hydrolase